MRKRQNAKFVDSDLKLRNSSLTSNSQLSSLGLTLHIILTTLRDSTSTGSGVTDFTDSVTSGDIARGRTGGGNFAMNAVNGYIPYLSIQIDYSCYYSRANVAWRVAETNTRHFEFLYSLYILHELLQLLCNGNIAQSNLLRWPTLIFNFRHHRVGSVEPLQNLVRYRLRNVGWKGKKENVCCFYRSFYNRWLY